MCRNTPALRMMKRIHWHKETPPQSGEGQEAKEGQ